MAKLQYAPSDSRTACVVCGRPIADAQTHFMAINATDNVAATLYNLTTQTPSVGNEPLRFVCRES
jgi:hypothetical protein